MDSLLLGSVTVETAESLDSSRLGQASELAHKKIGASVSVSSNGRLLDWRFRFDEAQSPVELARTALDVVTEVLSEVGIREWTLERVAALSDEEQRRETRRTSPVVGMAEAADLLGRSRQRISQYIAEGRFPEPLAHLRAGPVWPRDAILDFAQTIRSAGRPRRLVE
jgi:predicted DNA-binding transcriptional regulator AlpA